MQPPTPADQLFVPISLEADTDVAFPHLSKQDCERANASLKGTRGIPSTQLIHSWFSQMVGKDFEDTKAQDLARPEIVEVLFLLFNRCPTPLQMSICDRILGLIERSPVNLALLSECRTMEFILSALARDTVDCEVSSKLLQGVFLFAAFKVSVKQFKTLLGLTRTKDGQRTPIAARVIKIIQTLVQSKSPHFYFILDGLTSGFSLPVVELPAGGYSFCAWLRVDSFEDPGKGLYYEPRVFSFLNKEASGLECYFSGRTLFLRSSDKGSHAVLPLPFEFVLKRWYFISIVHWKRLGGIGDWLLQGASHPVRLYVDGALVYEGTLRYPRTVEPFTVSYIASNVRMEGPLKIPRKSPLLGMLGTCYLVKSAIESQQVGELFKMGPNYMTLPELSVLAPDNLIFGYSAKTAVGDVVFSTNAHTQMTAQRFPSTRVNVSLPVYEMIELTGGVRSLVFLFYLLELPARQASATPFEQPLSYTADPGLNSDLISTLADVLIESKSLLKQFKKMKAIPLLAYVLARMPPRHISLETLYAFERLLKAVVNSDLLVKHFYQHLYLNFRLWIYTEFSVQKSFLHSLVAHASANATVFVKQLGGIFPFLDALRYAYYLEAPADDSVDMNWKHPITRDALAQRPTGAQVAEARGILLTTIEVLVNAAPEELQKLLHFTQDNTEPSQLIDTSLTLLHILSNEGLSDQLSHHFRNLEHLYPLVALIARHNENIRLLGLRLLHRALEVSPRKERFMTEYGVSWIASLIEPFPFSPATYHTLLNVMFNTTIVENGHLQIPATEFAMHNPRLMPVIFRLLLGSDFAMRQRVLEDIRVLLSTRGKFCDSFVASYVGWPNWFFSLWADSATAGGVQLEVTREMITRLFCMIFRHNLLHSRDGTAVIQQTEASLRLFAERGVLDYANVMRALLMALLRSLEPEVKKVDPNLALLTNLGALIAVITEFVLVPVIPHKKVTSTVGSLYRDATGAWEDFALTEKALDMVFSSDLELLVDTYAVEGDMVRTLVNLLLVIVAEAPSCVPKPTGGQQVTALESVMHTATFRLTVLSKLPRFQQGPEYVSLQVWEVSSLIRAMKRSLRDNDTAHEVFVPLLRDMLANYCEKMDALLDCRLTPEDKSLLNNTAPPAAFVTYLTDYVNPNWNKIESVRRAIEEDQAVWAAKVALRRERHIETLMAEVDALGQEEAGKEKRLVAETQRLRERQQYIEVSRRSESTIQSAQRTAKLEEEWKSLIKTHNHDRWPWGPAPGARKWKLDATEDSQRRRLKLKINWNWDDHKAASHSYIVKEAIPSEEDVTQLHLPKETKLNVSFSELQEEETQMNEGEAWVVLDERDDGSMLHARLEEGEEKRLQATCELITIEHIIKGELMITQRNVHFFADKKQSVHLQHDHHWPLSDLVSVQRRRYLLRNSALEIFLLDNSSYFVNFPSKEKHLRSKVLAHLRALRPPNLKYIEVNESTPAKAFAGSGLTQKWLDRKMSNFDYLMALNTFAGRTYNDLTQYPVFPWIVADYTSSTLDLNNPKTFRDLTKPIGALEPSRLKNFLERYESFEDDQIPKFHYGSHYSSAGVVLFYLIRMEPFTSLFINLQGGKFDHADRTFFSIKDTWANCNQSTTDVKELTPEFYYHTEFLINSNGFDFGTRQNGEPVGNVQLPPWARTVEEFITLNRAALECEHVSRNLHHWIDLIFGYKQRGHEAVAAHNVFYYLTYEGAVDLDSIEDPSVRSSTQAQITHFGQTPSQLFTKPHPPRTVESLQSTLWTVSAHSPVLKPMLTHMSTFAPAAVMQFPWDLVFTTSTGDMHNVRWSSVATNTLPFYADLTSMPRISTLSLPPTHHIITFASRSVAMRELKVVAMTGTWDGCVRLRAVDAKAPAEVVPAHRAPVGAIAARGTYMVTGSADCTCRVWQLSRNVRRASQVEAVLKGALFDHDAGITCIDFSPDLDLIVSGSRDRTLILHTFRKCRYVRTLPHPSNMFPTWVALSCDGDIVMYSEEDKGLYVYNVNGKLLCTTKTNDSIVGIYITSDGRCDLASLADLTDTRQLLTAGVALVVRRLSDLSVICTHGSTEKGSSRIRCFTVADEERHVIVCYEDGRVVVMGFDETGKYRRPEEADSGWIKVSI